MIGSATAPALHKTAMRPEPWRANDLRPRELEVAALIACGMSDYQITKYLDISLSTVRSHAKGVMQRLDVHCRASIAVFVLTGYIPYVPDEME